MHGLLWVGFHEEKNVAEGDELKAESHESRERPSWFKAEMAAGKIKMLRRKKTIVIALLDMMRLVLLHCSNSSGLSTTQSLKIYLYVFLTKVGY